MPSEPTVPGPSPGVVTAAAGGSLAGVVVMVSTVLAAADDAGVVTRALLLAGDVAAEDAVALPGVEAVSLTTAAAGCCFTA